jgi:hypothetical protein
MNEDGQLVALPGELRSGRARPVARREDGSGRREACR